MRELATPDPRGERRDGAVGEGFAIEATAIGPQTLVPGVTPITMRDRLQWRAAAPLAPTKAQRGCDHGLFDLAARHQLEMFGGAPATSAATPSDMPGRDHAPNPASPPPIPNQLPPPKGDG